MFETRRDFKKFMSLDRNGFDGHILRYIMLGNFYFHLKNLSYPINVKKIPRFDFKHINFVYRFNARLVKDGNLEDKRRFLISYFLADDSIMITVISEEVK